MDSIWGLNSNFKVYSDNAEKVFEDLIKDQRKDFRLEFRNGMDKGLDLGDRFNNVSLVFWALQSNVNEVSFMRYPKHYIFRVLLGAAEMDYYYSNEKEW